VPDDYKKKDKTKVVGKGKRGHKVPDDYKKKIKRKLLERV